MVSSWHVKKCTHQTNWVHLCGCWGQTIYPPHSQPWVAQHDTLGISPPPPPLLMLSPSLSLSPSLFLSNSLLFSHGAHLASVVLGAIPPNAKLPLSDKTPNTANTSGISSALAATTATESATAWLNLLLPKSGSAAKEKKVWIGNGLPAIPKKIHDKIANWEFIDLADLKPAGTLDSLNPEPDPQNYIILPGLEIARARRKPIKDIITWVQCFVIFMAAVQQHDPGAINELLAYMFTIIRAAQEFEDPAWRSYDEAFREKAAATGNRKWSEIDSLIYNRVFTGHARKIPMATTNTTGPRPTDLPGPSHSPAQHTYYSEPPPPKRPAPMSSNASRSDICYLFNRGGCRFGNMCKFRHMCSICSGRHPRVSCKAGRPAPQGPKEPMMEKAPLSKQ